MPDLLVTRARQTGATVTIIEDPALLESVGGVGGFLRPFRRLGAILWLEMTGAFFLLFAAVSASFLWRNRASYAIGPDHRGFAAAAAMMAVFLYLGISSFWRARRR